MTVENRSSVSSLIRRPVAIAAMALSAAVLAGAAVFVAVNVLSGQWYAKAGAVAQPPQQVAQAPRRPQPATPATPPANPAPAATPAQQPATPPPAAPAAEAAPTAPVRTETVVYDNWTVTCRDTVGGTEKKVCSASFRMTEKERNAVIFTWVIGRNNEGALVSVMDVPTGLFIQPGLQFKIDNGAARKLDYTLCDQRHCEATIKMDDALTKEMAGAKAATVTIVSGDGKGINFNLIPKGIDKAISSIPR